jgi:hypothetical protein
VLVDGCEESASVADGDLFFGKFRGFSSLLIFFVGLMLISASS